MSSKLTHKVDSEARGTVDGTSLTDEIASAVGEATDGIEAVVEAVDHLTS